jgi:protein-S-isoprenylcysteine O-methyltransferase Ste14
MLPPAYFALAIVSAALAHFFLPTWQMLGFPWRFAGLLLVGVGAVLAVLAAQAFKRHQTSIRPFERPAALITGGVYRLSRNPIYLGMTVMLLGIAVFLGSAGALATVPALLVVLDRRFVTNEERMLARVFGARFDTYRRRVRRWV